MVDIEWTVRGIAAAVNGGAVSAREILDEVIHRIETRDGELNAVVSMNLDMARAAADRVEPGLPLAGVPMLVKDLHAEVVGLPLSRGSRRFADTAHHESSVLIQRLLAAGVVIIGRTNSPELGLNISTEPELWGPCRNPHDPDRSTGGSSGGSAAAVAAGMVPAAHGSDSGGSLRIPAAWCGVVGMKPTRGLVPCGPHRTNPWEGLSHEHALTTDVADSRLLLEIESARAIPQVSPGRLRIGFIGTTPEGVDLDRHCAGAALTMADALSDLGHEIVPLGYPPEAAGLGAVIAPVIAGHLALACQPDESAEADLDGLEPAIADLARSGVAMSAADHLRARDRMARAASSLDRTLDDFDLVLSPTTAMPAPPIGELHTDQSAAALFETIFQLSPYTVMYNVTGRPAISIPAGLDRAGVPLGAQLGARFGDDALLLAVAEQLLADQ